MSTDENAPTPARRTLRPAELVEELATTKQRCAALQRLFAYRKRLLDTSPVWFTQIVSGPILDPQAEPDRITAHTLLVGLSRSPEEAKRAFPELFVPASVRSRFGLEGEIRAAREPAEIFGAARDLWLHAPRAVEVPLSSAKEEGAARAILEARRVETRKGRVAASVVATSAPVSPSPATAPPSASESPEASKTAVEPSGDAAVEDQEPSMLRLVAYDIGSKLPVHLRPGSHERDWIEASPARYAARCLPLLIANQSGWEIVLDGELTVTWNGKPGLDAVTVQGDGAMLRTATSHFGLGIVTFHVPYLFRTPPGYNLLVRGPCNRPKGGIAPLEGVVETDWTAATFTMNWQLTDPGRPVRFVRGDVIAMVVPQRRGELERFEPRLIPILDDPEMASRHELFAQSRGGFLKDQKGPDGEDWQRSYFQGRDPDGTVAPDHQTRRKLRPFV